MKEKILCFCLPTCNTSDMFQFLLPSLKNIGELKGYASFSITFQPPYTEEEIKKCLQVFDELHLDYKYEYKEYTFEQGRTPLMQMRQDCALRYPNYKFYALLDDDMSFKEGIDKDYLNLIYWMLKNRNFSVACLKKGPNSPYNMIRFLDFENGDYSTESGVIFRGGIYYGFKGLVPETLAQKVGGKQDYSTAIWRILQGDSSIVLITDNCDHYENRAQPGYTEYGWTNFFDEDTLLYWLYDNNFIRFSNPERRDFFYRNFTKQFCDILYSKGCQSSASTFFKDIAIIRPIEEIINKIGELNERRD